MSVFSICNRLLASKLIPEAVTKYNKGILGADYMTFEKRAFYVDALKYIVSYNDAVQYMDRVIIEKGKIKAKPDWHIVYLTFPYDSTIGYAEGICIIVDTVNRVADSYIMEKSVDGIKMVCQWTDNNHVNYGSVDSKKSFLAKVFELAAVFFKYHDKEDIASQKNTKTLATPKKNIFQKISSWLFDVGTDSTGVVCFIFIIFIVGLFFSLSKCNKQDREVSKINHNDDSETVIVSDDDTAVVVNDNIINGIPADSIYCVYEDENGVIHELYKGHYDGVPLTATYVDKDGVLHELNNDRYYGTPRDNNGKTVSSKASEPRNIVIFSNGGKPYEDWFGKGLYDNESLAQLEVSNQSKCDAVVLLCDSRGNVVRQAFVKAHSVYNIRNLPSVVVIMKTMMGNDWNTLKDNGANYPKGGFESNEAYTISPWNNPFDFTYKYYDEGIEYPTYSVTLHAVTNGNFKTKESSKREFFQ